jgi:hypothetical protein
MMMAVGTALAMVVAQIRRHHKIIIIIKEVVIKQEKVAKAVTHNLTIVNLQLLVLILDKNRKSKNSRRQLVLMALNLMLTVNVLQQLKHCHHLLRLQINWLSPQLVLMALSLMLTVNAPVILLLKI